MAGGRDGLRLRAAARGSTSESGVIDRGGRVPRRVRLLRGMILLKMMTLLPGLSRCLSSGLSRLAPSLPRRVLGAFLTGCLVGSACLQRG
jgi:hypothetical protein